MELRYALDRKWLKQDPNDRLGLEIKVQLSGVCQVASEVTEKHPKLIEMNV